MEGKDVSYYCWIAGCKTHKKRNKIKEQREEEFNKHLNQTYLLNTQPRLSALASNVPISFSHFDPILPPTKTCIASQLRT